MLRLSCEKAVITVPPAEGLHVLPAAFDRSVQKPREPQQRKEEKDMNRIGIIGAMDIEVARLKEMMTDVTVTKKASMEFNQGLLNGKPVVVVQCGIGKVNAGICTQILVDDFQVDAVINTGVAGSLRNEINIGDIVISTDAVHHDMDVRALGYKKGQIPQIDVFAFPADETMQKVAAEACREVNPEIQVFSGRVLSGDQFISDHGVKSVLVDELDGFCTEMEGAAIAQAAYLNHIPYVILRAISDKADDSATMDYPEFERKAAQHCVNLTQEMVKRL